MTTPKRTAVSVGLCPRCAGAFTRTERSWTCEDCGLVPNHGAD
ncbi:MAG: hypothetical protein V5A62_11785 [Haloarculaceae archaeon]